MSEEAVFKTKLNDEECLVEALESLYGKETIVRGGTRVKGYSSFKEPTILINIPNIYGTAGFYKNAEGNFEAVYDSMDVRKLSKLFPHKNGDITIDQLTQAYNKAKVKKMLQNISGTIENEEVEEGNVEHIVAVVRNYG